MIGYVGGRCSDGVARIYVEPEVFPRRLFPPRTDGFLDDWPSMGAHRE